jgi:phage terminase large subunit-like protein
MTYPSDSAPSQTQYPVYQQQAPRPTLSTTLAHTNTFALVAMLLVFLQPIAGVVFGHLALNQIKRNGDAGRGLALTAVIVGYAFFVMILVIVLSYIAMLVLMFASLGAAVGEFNSFDNPSGW